ncbi:ATP-binding protein [Dasania sp. GY-MA-18]|uniref:histidine kinase n=1 Tax=Dasania phycosphaerae TaxID=2950436 RepID=A0A9J6RKX1_9GAMM|nr:MULTISPECIES: ATP-binding protein [Dasania]MCR8922717.1 ATP-binding protein [Dasania sp. GY-MA-18]MCZ0865147.1 ATP-binding protein [Dasania phycosphaerae]MCZ0868873.1 ATP-binding protein [Dasania phycosphaerae]
MSLNKQLLCISLLLLAMPWAGCQYLQEMDGLLRQNQDQTLMASSKAIAAVLSQRAEQLLPFLAKDSAAGEQQDRPLYFHALNSPLEIDGYPEGWQDIAALVVHNPNKPQQSTRYRSAIYQDQLYLFFEVQDAELRYNNPSRSLTNDGDRIIVNTGSSRDKEHTQAYIFTTSAPGYVTARYNTAKGTFRESRIRAHWQDSEQGYNVEIAIPMALTAGKLSFQIIDQNYSNNSTDSYGPFASSFNHPPAFIYQTPDLAQQLAIFKQPGLRLKVYDRRGWLLAQQGSFNSPSNDDSHWLLKKLYRALLQNQNQQLRTYPDEQVALQRHEIQQALQQQLSSQHYQDGNRSNHRIIASAAPILLNTETGTQIIASLVAEQSSEQMAALTDSAFKRLLSKSLGVMSIVGLGLLAYASLLSWRIRRLSRATQSVINEQGQWLGEFPHSNSQDEIGELSRNYGQLLARIKDYTDYLQTLSRKLSHELRTPLAIIHSSLDNLGNQDLPAQSATYQQRAKQGALRLGKILTAMSEASRVEESISHAEMEDVDINALLSSLSQAYQDCYPSKTITLHNTLAAGCILHVSPDLLVQLLDKLMDNAASFCPEGGQIIFVAQQHKQAISISLSNDGPLLPEKMRGQLFDNMVSLRDDKQDGTHLGLGLHIAYLIAQFHQGKISGQNRDDNSGVIFTLSLPLSLLQPASA